MSRSQGRTRPQEKAFRACQWCGKSFRPHVRVKERQKSCGSPHCRKKQRANSLKLWRQENLQVVRGYQDKREKRPPGFWPQYRATHPDSTQRNREQSKIRARLRRKSLQRNLDIFQVAESPRKSETFTAFATAHRSSILTAFAKEDSS